MVPVVSSHLARVGYDPERKVLVATFQNGDSYAYFGVPYSKYANLLSASSKGRYFNAAIVNGGYHYARAS
jgi:hypothetical protein